MKTKNIFEELRVEHNLQRTLLESIINTAGESSERRRLFTRIKLELKIHALAEERYLYIPMLKCDTAQKKARHSIAEH
jgi:hemerythrin superfamily protein